MKPSTLFIIDSDPRTSHRPAEAVRIAAGVSAWKKTDVTLYLRGPSVLALGEWVDELVEEDNFTRYLPILRDTGRPVYVEQNSPFLGELCEATLPFEPVDDSQLARLAAQHTCVLRF